MTIWSIIKRFQYEQVWQLLMLSVKYPLFVFPTLKATSKSFLTAKKEFPTSHGKKGKANAFRHAFWNAYICFESSKWSSNKKRVLTWAKQITDKHEELSPNEPLDRAMDLHNNRIGRMFFDQQDFKNADEIVAYIKDQLKMALKVDEIGAIQNSTNTLVYIKEE